jgi:nucleotide-binding universal stress UspA family protein
VQSLASGLSAEVVLLAIVDPEGGSFGDQGPPPPEGILGPPAPGTGASGEPLERSKVVDDPKYGELPEQATMRVKDEAVIALDRASKPLRDAGITVKNQVLVGKDAAPLIIEVAAERKPDMIAMATHGRSGLSALVQGSVAAEVVRSGVAPVLLVRPVD